MRLLHGDCVEVMRGLPECSVDAVVTDPPYELGFMGKAWDGAGVAYSVTMWSEALRVLKPGGHLLAFGGTRTYHRMACAIEDAGFEIRDSIHWVYGSGFPKSLDVSKAIDKVNGEGGRALKFTGWMRTTGLTARRLDELTGTNMGGHYVTAKSQPAIPTAAMWAVIRPHCGEVPEWVDELVARVEAEREVVGERTVTRNTQSWETTAGMLAPGEKHIKDTVAATDEARRWEGWGTALKPAHEPVVVARKPLVGTVAGNVLAYGTGGLNIDGCRVGIAPGDEPKAGHRTATFGTQETVSGGDGSGGWQASSGRWPANVVFDRAAGEALDQQSGTLATNKPVAWKRDKETADARRVRTGYGVSAPEAGEVRVAYSDKGGASRFFTQADFGPDDWPFVYQAKPSRKERNAGLDGLPERRKVFNGKSDKPGSMKPGSVEDRQTAQPAPNHHPTVKPVALMRHLVRLVTPPGGTVLDPFAGSGTTLVAAILEGFDCIGIEMTDEYLPIIEGRTAWAVERAAARGAEQATLL